MNLHLGRDESAGNVRAFRQNRSLRWAHFPRKERHHAEPISRPSPRQVPIRLFRKIQELGRKGEEAAVRFLVRRGYDIVERNWTCIAGEADIIALDGDTVVFVEVKTRTSAANGLPGEAVTKEKRARYEKIACLYLEHSDITDVSVRFDVVAINIIGTDRAFIRHHIDAFGVGF